MRETGPKRAEVVCLPLPPPAGFMVWGRSWQNTTIRPQVALIRVLLSGLSYECALNQITDALLFSWLKQQNKTVFRNKPFIPLSFFLCWIRRRGVRGGRGRKKGGGRGSSQLRVTVSSWLTGSGRMVEGCTHFSSAAERNVQRAWPALNEDFHRPVIFNTSVKAFW